METFILTIEMQVSENWVDDGFNPLLFQETQKSIEDALTGNLLNYAYSDEFKVKIKKVRELKK